MKDLLAWYGLKRFPFDKNIKSAQAMDTEPLKECLARLDYIKRRGGRLDRSICSQWLYLLDKL